MLPQLSCSPPTTGMFVPKKPFSPLAVLHTLDTANVPSFAEIKGKFPPKQFSPLKDRDVFLPIPLLNPFLRKRHAIAPLPASENLEAILSHIESVSQTDECDQGFFVVDLARISQKYHQWTKAMPRVTPYYAVKCNPDVVIVDLLSTLGAGFDCASKAEVVMALDAGIDPSRIIFANPCKSPADIRFARSVGVMAMTFDSVEELDKVKGIFPEAKLVIRMKTDDTKASVRLGCKFGATLDECEKLIQHACEAEMEIIGVSFHVGSGCYDTSAYDLALTSARKVFDMGAAAGYNFELLDIGGGFPGYDDGSISLSGVAEVINPLLDKLFPSTVRVISEPGRYFVTESHTLAVSVIAKKKITTENDTKSHFLYTLNGGVFGGFKNRVIYKYFFTPQLLSPGVETTETFSSALMGPTGHKLDCVSPYLELPELEVGAWLYYPRMGAYTFSLASCYNGFDKIPKHYIWSGQKERRK